MTQRPIRIANCSGFYGDRISAPREMVQGGPIDVLTGDYLAELTMLLLWKGRQKAPSTGYARTFLTQVEQVLGDCLDRGIKIVTNAGGLNPAGCAEQITELAQRLGLAPKVAYVSGDDLIDRIDELQAAGIDLANLDTGQPLAETNRKPITANAYLGGWGIASALAAGTDIVVCPRVTDASLVVGPAAWWHGWARDDWDALAGAVAAGHVIECGPQATGGNYSDFAEITDRRYPGFPIAEVAADGSSVITKHPGTGGLVSPGTVTAQLLYEIADPAYPNPDVVAHFDTLTLSQEAEHRVLISGCKGSPPPETLKVAINQLGGYRNTMTMVITGLDIEEKAAWTEGLLFDVLGGRERFEAVDVQLLRFDHADAAINAEATAHLRVTVKDPDPRKVGRAFSSALLELGLASYPGFHTTGPPTSETEYGVYWPALVPARYVEHVVVLPDGSRELVPHTPPVTAAAPSGSAARAGSDAERAKSADQRARSADQRARSADAPAARGTGPSDSGATERVPLGRICAARSGDKGGNANIGLWARSDAGHAWLSEHLTVERFRALLPEAAELAVRRYELPNLRALNFVVVGLLGEGVASGTRPDAQAKGLGEYVRSRLIDIPANLL